MAGDVFEAVVQRVGTHMIEGARKTSVGYSLDSGSNATHDFHMEMKVKLTVFSCTR